MNFLSGLGVGKSVSVAVEIDKSYIKIAEAEYSGKGLTITRLLTEPISGFSDDEVLKTFADIIKANDIRIDKLIAIISRDRIMVRYLRLPATAPGEIDDMVSFEIAKQIPYSVDEVVSDYRIMSLGEDGYSQIMLVVVSKDEAERVNGILQHIGKRPSSIRSSSDALLAWFNNINDERARDKTICLINIDTDNAEISVISNEKLYFSRVAPIGAINISKDQPNAEISKNRLISEINNSIVMYKKTKPEGEKEVSEFLVTGAGSLIEDFSSFLQAETGKPARFVSALATLPLADDALTDKGVAQDSSICDVCGSLFIKDGINLISHEQRERQKAQDKIKKAAAIFAVIVTILCLFTASFLTRLYQNKASLDKMQVLLKKIEPEAERIEEKLKRLEVIKAQSAEGASLLDAIYNIYRLMPSTVSLMDFNYDEASKTVRFRGTADRMSDVSKLPTILEASEKFSNVQIRSAAMIRKQQGEVVDFQIWCLFSPKTQQE